MEAAIAVTGTTETETPKAEGKTTAAELFEERQRQYLRGRKDYKEHHRQSGMMIIRAGETISDPIIDRAKAAVTLVEW